MYETNQETAGLCGCPGRAKPPQRFELVSAPVLYQDHASLQEKGARARRQTYTGGVKTSNGNDDSILAGKPAVIRWFCYALAALAFTGILPMAVCELLFRFFDTFSCWWLEIPLFAGVLWAMWKLIERDLR